MTALLFEFWDPYPLDAFEEAPADAFLSLSEDDDSSPSAVKEKIIRSRSIHLTVYSILTRVSRRFITVFVVMIAAVAG